MDYLFGHFEQFHLDSQLILFKMPTGWSDEKQMVFRIWLPILFGEDVKL